MIAKAFEIRGAGTFLAVLAIKLSPANEAERYLAARAGYGLSPEDQSDFVLMSPLYGSERMEYEPLRWTNSGRTRTVAHTYIMAHFDELEPGAVVDVEYILGETYTRKVSEAKAAQEGKEWKERKET